MWRHLGRRRTPQCCHLAVSIWPGVEDTGVSDVLWKNLSELIVSNGTPPLVGYSTVPKDGAELDLEDSRKNIERFRKCSHSFGLFRVIFCFKLSGFIVQIND